MNDLPQVSRVALAAGLPARYVYWSGQSGRRYLFTCIGAGALADFDCGVAIAVSGGETVWIGDVTELAAMPAGSRARRAEIYVHLLASTLAERRAVIADMRPARQELRLAA
jgi:hypothetical protein